MAVTKSFITDVIHNSAQAIDATRRLVESFKAKGINVTGADFADLPDLLDAYPTAAEMANLIQSTLVAKGVTPPVTVTNVVAAVESLWGKNAGIPVNFLDKISGSETKVAQIDIPDFLPKVDMIVDAGDCIVGYIHATRQLWKYSHAPHAFIAKSNIASWPSTFGVKSIKANATHLFLIDTRGINIIKKSDLSFVRRDEMPCNGYELFSCWDFNDKIYFAWGTGQFTTPGTTAGIIIFDMNTMIATNYNPSTLPGRGNCNNVSANALGVYVTTGGGITMFKPDMSAEIDFKASTGGSPYCCVCSKNPALSYVYFTTNTSGTGRQAYKPTASGFGTIIQSSLAVGAWHNRAHLWDSFTSSNGEECAINYSLGDVIPFDRAATSRGNSNANFTMAAVKKTGDAYISRWYSHLVFSIHTVQTSAAPSLTTTAPGTQVSQMNASSVGCWTSPQLPDVVAVQGGAYLVDLTAQTITPTVNSSALAGSEIITFDRTHVWILTSSKILTKRAWSNLSVVLDTWTWVDGDFPGNTWTPNEIKVFPSQNARELIILYNWDNQAEYNGGSYDGPNYYGCVLETVSMDNLTSTTSRTSTGWQPYYGSPQEGMFCGSGGGVQGAIFDGGYYSTYNWGYFNQIYESAAYSAPRRFVFLSNSGIILMAINDYSTYTDVSMDIWTYKRPWLAADALQNYVRTTANNLINVDNEMVMCDNVSRTLYSLTGTYSFHQYGFIELYKVVLNSMKPNSLKPAV